MTDQSCSKRLLLIVPAEVVFTFGSGVHLAARNLAPTDQLNARPVYLTASAIGSVMADCSPMAYKYSRRTHSRSSIPPSSVLAMVNLKPDFRFRLLGLRLRASCPDRSTGFEASAFGAELKDAHRHPGPLDRQSREHQGCRRA